MENSAEKTNTKSTPDKSVKIREAYIDYLLEHGAAPASVYHFMKILKMKEGVFYEYYNSFSAIEKDIWKGYFDKTLSRIQSDSVYNEYTVREKLLAFYYTWIEVLRDNRSYVTYSVNGAKRQNLRRMNMDFLSSFKTSFLDYVNDLIAEGKETEEIVDRPIVGSRYDDGLWQQLLFVLKFWVNDDSKGFERTDAAIEKAVNLSFDLMSRSALDAAFDFARFLYQGRK
ncbi:TetR/AcrR family transcriptional regulator [Catalinimonas niigatensis]|uniref:TetR/AcrR family transcriptional regulator n=1 Tax=Catalinimonas niigatensis TaxID=1397264 RepID=UPI002667197D|nr:TetR family transcriptional regulator C-terminal domain-containing protein [Catalinimonas niigatensis]WPP52218.1 TetR family transcriptional regulator C-terminal domain-containing protein [Catalinimonas niigatensis]